MTENEERLEELKGAVCRLVCIAEDVICGEDFEELDNAGAETIDCLEELQQYRAIGTVERFRFLQEVCDLNGDELENIANSMIELKNYRAIGTIEEFKALKEKFENAKDDIQTIDVSELLGAQGNDGWIPCSERLPDDFMSMEYLTTVKGRFYSEINYYCVVNHKWYSNERTTKEVNVIAWMPKPTVYQPKGQAND